MKENGPLYAKTFPPIDGVTSDLSYDALKVLAKLI